MCPFWMQSSRPPLSISGISEVRANTSSELRAAPGMPRDVAGLARTADGTQPKALLAPYPAEEMTCWPVSPRVGNVKNNHPSLIEPIAGAGWARRIGWPMEAMSWAQMARHAPRYAGAGCVRQGGQAQAPYTLENVHDRGGDGTGADGGCLVQLCEGPQSERLFRYLRRGPVRHVLAG
jgi:hypothetical protein